MAVADYNRQKLLDVDSVSGTPTVDKATPVLVKGESTTLIDTYSDPDVTGSNVTSVTTTLSSTADNIVSLVRFYVNNADTVTVTVQDSVSNTLVEQTVSASSGTNTVNFDISDYSEIIQSENFTITITANETDNLTVLTGETFSGSEVSFNSETVPTIPLDSGQSVFEFESVERWEGQTGNGDIVLDWTNISSESDLAVYDENDNLLPYEIESFDATSETATLWVYDSWVRDGSTQAKVVYGDGPASSEENVTGTWNNTGQNTLRAYHFNNGAGTDSAGNNDLTINGAPTTVSGDLGDGLNFDGTDDSATIPDLPAPSQYTYVIHAEHEAAADESNDSLLRTDANSINILRDQNSGTFNFFHQNGSTFINYASASISNNSPVSWIATWNGSTLEGYKNGVSQGSASESNISSGGGGSDTLAEEENADFFDGTISEARFYSEGKDSDWVQAEHDATPKGGQVFFTQQAAEDTANTVTDTAVKSSASTTTLTSNENVDYLETATKTSATATSQTSTEFVTVTETVVKSSATATPLTSTEVSSATDIAVKSSATTTSLTSLETADYLDQATKTNATTTSLTSTETEVLIDIAVKSSATTTSLTSTEIVTTLDVDTAVKSTASATSLTSTETLITVDQAVKSSAAVSPLTSEQFASTTDTAVKSSAAATSLQADTVFDAVATAVKSSATSTSLTSTERIVNADEAVKTQVTATSLTSTETDIIKGFQIFLNTEATNLINVDNEAK